MSTGWDSDDGDESEAEDGDSCESIHEIETDFEPVPIDEAEAESEAGAEVEADGETEDEPLRAPIAEFQYEPYSIAENGPPVCPLCGQQLSMVRIDEPGRAVVSPCGCRMPPDPFFGSSSE